MEVSTRRYMLRTTIEGFLYACSAMPSMAAAAVERNGGRPLHLNWQRFVDELEALAHQQHKPFWDQGKYIQRVEPLAAQLQVSKRQLVQGASQRQGKRNSNYPEFADLLRTTDVQVSLISFDKGDAIPHHDHPGMTGVMTCAVGYVTVDEYDIIAERNPSDVFLKYLGQVRVVPGEVAGLTAQARNVHAVRSAVFSQLVDIFTPPYDAQKMSGTRWFTIDDQPKSPGALIRAHSRNR